MTNVFEKASQTMDKHGASFRESSDRPVQKSPAMVANPVGGIDLNAKILDGAN